jgi:beta-glucosidase
LVDRPVRRQVQHVLVRGPDWLRGARAEAINTVVGERALQEIYYPPFKAVVMAGVGSVMSSYNRLNGTYASQHPSCSGCSSRPGTAMAASPFKV